MLSLRKFIAPVLLAFLLLITSCTQAPSRFEQAQKESTQGTQRNQAVSKEAEEGGSFNKFFPAAGEGYKLVFSQEKKGFAQAKLQQNGKDVAVLTINDIISNSSAKDKFKQSTEKIDGYPVVNQGKTATAVLVADRYQVKVRSTTLTEDERKEWLDKFDLNSLARLK
ncbi:MAG: hypothetical protein QNJ54_14340 [Prochloraceae cyanobacterium]|nr:hypothetical protein [Prochloraceae cyanobacterium]